MIPPINFLAKHYHEFEGFGRMGLFEIRALNRLGVDVFPGVSSQLESPAWFQRLQGWDFNRLTISLMQPRELQGLPGRQWGYTMYETTKVPDDWGEKIINCCDRLIVPAPFLVDVFKRAQVDIPIHVVRGGIDPEECPLLPKPCARSGKTPFTFMALGDRGSRKGWDIAYQAYFKAFGNNPKVRLVIKTREGGLGFLPSFNDLQVSIWRADVPRISDIWSFVDAFVFPSRGEGESMPPKEAVACGVPTIATKEHAMDDADLWAIPIGAKLAEARDMGGFWWEPCVDEVAEKMTWIFEHQEEAKARAIAGREWLLANRTWEHSARALIELIETYGSLPGERELKVQKEALHDH